MGIICQTEESGFVRAIVYGCSLITIIAILLLILLLFLLH